MLRLAEGEAGQIRSVEGEEGGPRNFNFSLVLKRIIVKLKDQVLFFLLHCCFFTLDAGLLARSQYSEGPATGHLDTGFSWFPCV